MIITIVSFALLLGLYHFFDMIYAKKTKGYFIRSLVIFLTVSIPAIYQAIANTEIENLTGFAKIWLTFFYPIMIATIFVLLLLAYFGIFRPLCNNFYKYTNTSCKYTYFDFLFSGYNEFKEKIDKKIEEHQKSLEISTDSFKKVHSDLRGSLPSYITWIYTIIHDGELEEYIYLILESFISKFLSENDARFTFRFYDEKTKQMCTELTTREISPSPIPIDKPNLITESMNRQEPVIYSRCVNFHYDTGKSLKKQKFDDYVTFCLLKDENSNIPIASVNLDVKGKHAIERMHALVDSSIFTVVCNAIIYRLEYEFQNEEVSK